MRKVNMMAAVICLLSATFFAQTKIITVEPGSQGTKIEFSGTEENGLHRIQMLSPLESEAPFMLMEMGGEQVKDAPYTATAVTESVQTLSDGNRITHKSTASIARDGQGRTRREESMSKMGGVSVDGHNMVIINDPSAKNELILHPKEQTAETMKFDSDTVKVRAFRKERIERSQKDFIYKVGPGDAGESKKESLGTQVIEGVSCDGTRITRTIAAGAIGNERPIEIVTETWFSPELKTLVMKKSSDPRSGETTYRLTQIKRGEPDPALFQAPEGFKVTPMGGKYVIEKHME
jgi:hypothetical protein